MKNNRYIQVWLAVSLLAIANLARADDSGKLEFSGSGFLTLAAGKVLSGSHDPDTDQGYNCPCFVSDYAQGGVYQTGGWKLGPDSRLGLQGTVSVDHGRYALTGQVVSRGAVNGTADLEWLYGTLELNSRFTLQLGRKRLPLFNYSEAQDVGYSYPWIHLPPQLYGWEIVNYTGANLLYRDQWGEWSSAINVFAGNETKSNSGYWKIYNGKSSQTDARWTNILGGDVKLSRDWFEGRFVYVQSYTQNKIVSDDETEFSSRKKQRIFGLSFNIDIDNWFVRTEHLYINRKQDYGRDFSQLYGVGRHFGSLSPFVSYTSYKQKALPDIEAPEGHSTTSIVLRYDFGNSSAVKAQYDFWHDRAKGGYSALHGNAHLLSISYDRVF